MDTATNAMEKVFELRKKNTALDERRAETESALARESQKQATLTAERAKFVAELAGADDATVAFAHHEIDRVDSDLRLSSRVAEGLTKSHARIVSEIAAVASELADATETVEREERVKGLSEFQNQIDKDRSAAEDALGNAREALAALNLTAWQGVEKYGTAAQGLAAPVLEEFRHRQFNPENYGWLPAVANYASLQFTVRPMVKKAETAASAS